MSKNELLSLLKGLRPEMETRFGVVKIGFFGSFARDEASEDSDIDFIVELKNEKKFDHFFELLDFLRRHTGRRIDLGIESSLKSDIRSRIMDDVIYV